MAYSRAYTLGIAALVVLFALACSTLESSGSGYSSVVLHLDQFQTPAGGFVLSREAGARSSLEATSHALFLSSLFGLKKKINSAEVPKFLQSFENKDGGYGRGVSDLESVRYAVLSYKHLGLSVPNQANLVAFIKSLIDSETHLFSMRHGEAGSLKATALAVHTLETLQELSRFQDTFEHLRTYLAQHNKPGSGNNYYSFPEERGLSLLSANYYGIYLSSKVGVELGSLAKWAQFIGSLQNKATGGFYTTLDKTNTSVEATSHAVSALHILQERSKENTDFVNSNIDTGKLFTYARNIPENLRSAAEAHLAIALTKRFINNFDVIPSYEVMRASGVVDHAIVQGALLRPILAVRTFGRIAHAGLDVEAQIAHGGDKSVSKLNWKDNEQYVSDDSFDTSDRLGDLSFTYVVRCFVAGVGELGFNVADDKKVGYGVTVASSAKLEVSGKEFSEGEAVPVGTSFEFTVALHNHSNTNLVSGDFNIIFSVVDSSDVAIHTETRDGKKNSGPVNFEYVLKSNSLPGGNIGFRFEVSNANGVHTTKTVNYQLSLPMIATAINFEGFTRDQAPTYKLGDKVQVTIEPATFPDLHTVYHYKALGASSRQFFMDVSSPNGVLLRSITGQPVESTGNAKYAFSIPVTATLDSIGTNVVSFRYKPASGEDVQLSNYDSTYSELYDDTVALNYTVNAELQMVDVKEQPSGNDYYYGNEISYHFAIKDAITGQRVEKGESDNANVYLSLQHQSDDARSFASTNEPASEVVHDGQKGYYIKWAINPNAVQGKGYLTLNAQDADGNRFPLFAEGTKDKSVRYDVNIGGNITVDAETYSTSDIHYENTAFVAQFTLSCQDKQLKNAHLRCSVVRKDNGEAIASLLPAATNEVGEYSLSFTVPHTDAPSGDYFFRCYREVDRRRAAERTEAAIKKARMAEELKQFGEESSKEAEKVPDAESTLEPLFTIPLRHAAPYTGRLPVRTEYLAFLLFGAAFFYASYRKREIVA